MTEPNGDGKYAVATPSGRSERKRRSEIASMIA